MADPDSWPILQLFVALTFFSLCMLYTGVLAEHTSQKNTAGNSGLGVSRHTVACVLLSLPFAAWAVVCVSRIVHALGILTQTGSHPAYLYYVVAVPGYVIFAVITAMLCCVLPLSFGCAQSEVYYRHMRFMRPFVALFVPLAKWITLPARGIARKRNAPHGPAASEQAVQNFVDSATENAYIDESQKEMIGNIFELADVTASDIMTHRTEIEAVSVDAAVADILEKAVELGYSRIPVYDGSLDNIIGIANVKDLLQYVGKGIRNVDVAKLVRPTLFVPESCRARDLLLDFKQEKIQLAVVVDEYGGTAGIVTMEDILESIVGDIEDEYDEEETYIVENPDGSLTCDGYAEIEDVFALLGIEVPEDVESDTIGGLLTDLLARIPKKEECASATYEALELTALDVDERRITSVLVAPVRADIDAHADDLQQK